MVDRGGVRLDRYVVEKCPELSRTQAQNLIAGGNVMVNGRPAKAGIKLDEGDRLTVAIPAQPDPLSPEAIPLRR